MTASNTEPDDFVAGTTVTWTKKDTRYPRSEGWALEYGFNGPTGGLTGITGTADPDDPDGWLVTLTASQTAALAAGRYVWQAFVSKAAERFLSDQGSMTVLSDVSTEPSGLDTRSHARKVLDAIEAVIEGRATKDQESYSIAGRSLSRTPLEQLREFRNQYKAEVNAEDALEDAKNGKPSRNTIYGVFGRA